MNEGIIVTHLLSKTLHVLLWKFACVWKKYMTRLLYQFVSHQVHVVIQNLKMAIPSVVLCQMSTDKYI